MCGNMQVVLLSFKRGLEGKERVRKYFIDVRVKSLVRLNLMME